MMERWNGLSASTGFPIGDVRFTRIFVPSFQSFQLRILQFTTQELNMMVGKHREPITVDEWAEIASHLKAGMAELKKTYDLLAKTATLADSKPLIDTLKKATKAKIHMTVLMAKQHGYDDGSVDRLFYGNGWTAWL